MLAIGETPKNHARVLSKSRINTQSSPAWVFSDRASEFFFVIFLEELRLKAGRVVGWGDSRSICVLCRERNAHGVSRLDFDLGEDMFHILLRSRIPLAIVVVIFLRGAFFLLSFLALGLAIVLC